MAFQNFVKFFALGLSSVETRQKGGEAVHTIRPTIEEAGTTAPPHWFCID